MTASTDRASTDRTHLTDLPAGGDAGGQAAGATGVAPATGVLTFLFTDIEGSTARWEAQRVAMAGALVRHDALLRAAI